MTDEEGHDPETGEVGVTRSDKAIGEALYRSYQLVEETKRLLGEVRRKCAAEVATTEAAFTGSVEAGDDGTPEGARRKLNAVTMAWQDMRDAQERRKHDVDLVRNALKTAESKFAEQIRGVKQLGLFDE